MPAGLIVYNDNGQYQIDESYYSWTVMAHGNVYAGTTIVDANIQNGNRLIKQFTLVAPSDTVFAIYCPVGVGGIHKATYSGTTWTVQILLARDITDGSVLNDSGAKWFALHRPPAPPAGTKYGLEVYDASGNTRFSSFWRAKAPSATTPGNSANKFAFIGGDITYLYEMETEEVTTGQYYYMRYYWLTAGTSNNGTVSQDTVLYQYTTETREGTGGGGSFAETDGVNQPMLAIDVTEYI